MKCASVESPDTSNTSNTSNIPKIHESDYPTLKKYYDEELNTNQQCVVTTNDEPTPIDCVEDMVGKIPPRFWENPDLKILDPCCGCGNFPIVIYHKLIQHHDRHHILTHMLYFNDINLDRLAILEKVFDHPLNIYQHDFMELTLDIKFDLIVANPPYAKLLPNGKRASKNHNLIGAFIQKSLELLRPTGYLLYITPDNWMSYADRNTLIHKLTSLQIVYLNIHIAKKYFKRIGSSFTWYLIENTPSYKPIEIEGVWKKTVYRDLVKSEPRRFIPLFYTSTVQSILHKTIDNLSLPKFKIETSSDLHKYTKKQCIQNHPDEIYRYKLIHTPKQTVWSSRPHKYQEGYKVFISTTSYYGTFVDHCGMTQSIAFIRCTDQDQANMISKVLNHPMYRFLNNICRYGNFNNIRVMQQFPYCEDETQVYESFGLTPHERSYIEDHI